MKTISIILFCATLLATSCKKDDDEPENPVDSLPLETQVGAQTFGCLVDGEVFLPKTFGQNILNAFNQNIGGKFTLVISASNNENTDINIQGLNLDSVEEGTYDLTNQGNGNYNIIHIVVSEDNRFILETNSSNPGQLIISRHDKQNFILSGTFEYSLIDDEGNEIKVTDGRFDVNYTN